MSIEEYIHFVQGPAPYLFLFLVIFCEYIFLKFNKKNFSFSHTLANFGVLFIGLVLFSFFSHYVLTRDSVLAFVSHYSLIYTPVSWIYFFLWLIIFDGISYATHVLYHTSRFFWMFHSVHHSDNNLDASTTIRVPVVSAFFTITSFAFFSFLGANPQLLSPIAQTIFFHQIITHSFLFRNSIPHIFSYIFITPNLHALHHTEKYGNKNYGFLFSFWDKLFSTHVLKKYEGEGFGVAHFSKTNNPFIINIEPIIHFFKNKN